MEAQSATIPGSVEFDVFVLSNASLAVAAMLRSYLSSATAGEVEAKVTLGLLMWDKETRSGFDDG